MHSDSSEIDLQAGDTGRPQPPYPLSPGSVGLWLRRGEHLGQAAGWIAATLAAGHRRIAKWRRQVPRSGPFDSPPPQPG